MVVLRTRTQPNPRSAFTLIELMIVIVIIAILMAFLVPAVGGAIRQARITGVVTEISQLETAIAKFKTDRGIEPPSSITLYETGTDWTGDPASSALIRQIWPQFNFSMNRDLNNDGDSGSKNQKFTLTLGECLVFFLGGIPQKDSSGLISVTGFSKDPSDPFAALVVGASRDASLFEFVSSRLKIIGTHSNSSSGFPFPAYLDNLPSQTLPYLYYSSYDGQGYVLAEFGSGGLSTWYSQGTNATDPPWKPTSHQLISPGYDKIYGYGGPFIASGSNRLPAGTPTPPTQAQRAGEADNITNFSSGVLQP